MQWVIEPLALPDQALLERQIGVVNDLLNSLKESLLDASIDDCQRLQKIIDSGCLQASDTWQLQCLGIALGQIMVRLLGLHWIIVNDEFGRDLALRLQCTSLIIYPLTMISKRVERNEDVDVLNLFDLTADHVKRAPNQ